MRPIEKISITDEVVARIKELIMSGEYNQGDKLPAEQKLCETLGVSRTTIREGLRILQALGFVKTISGRGAFVAKTSEEPTSRDWVDLQDIAYVDFMQVRLVIEPVAARLAVQNCNDSEIEGLDEIHKGFVDAVQKKDLVKMMLGDDSFHRHIFMMARNKLMIGIYEKISEVYLKYRKESFTSDDIYNNALMPHQNLLECIKRRDAEGAENEMSIHMQMALTDMNRMHQR